MRSMLRNYEGGVSERECSWLDIWRRQQAALLASTASQVEQPCRMFYMQSFLAPQYVPSLSVGPRESSPSNLAISLQSQGATFWNEAKGEEAPRCNCSPVFLSQNKISQLAGKHGPGCLAFYVDEPG